MEDLDKILSRVAALPDGQAPAPDVAGALIAVADKYPYFTAAAISLLRHCGANLDEGRIATLRHNLALAAADRRTVLTAKYGDEWVKFYPEAPEEVPQETVDVIVISRVLTARAAPKKRHSSKDLFSTPPPTMPSCLPVRNRKSCRPRATTATRGRRTL